MPDHMNIKIFSDRVLIFNICTFFKIICDTEEINTEKEKYHNN